MKLVDWLVMILSFAAGVAAGSYIYFTGFREIDIDPETVRSVGEFEIVVSTYGGCQRNGTCSSYRLRSDGSYVFSTGDTAESLSGTLDTTMFTQIQNALVNTDVALQSTKREPDFCESWVDGVDVEYDIVRGPERYLINTCDTTIDVDSALIETLDELLLTLKEQYALVQ